MTPASVLALLGAAVEAGHAVASIIDWARERHPELRTTPWPDETRAMIDARAQAVARIKGESA